MQCILVEVDRILFGHAPVADQPCADDFEIDPGTIVADVDGKHAGAVRHADADASFLGLSSAAAA